MTESHDDDTDDCFSADVQTLHQQCFSEILNSFKIATIMSFSWLLGVLGSLAFNKHNEENIWSNLWKIFVK